MNFITFLMLTSSLTSRKSSQNVTPPTTGSLKPLTGFDYVLIGSVVVLVVGLVVHLVS
jgi:hypothetical protein